MYFLARGIFYSCILPLWEGYDEFEHFAFVQYLATDSRLPSAASTRVSREVQDSLMIVPLPWTLRDFPAPHVTHDEFWRLPPEEREIRGRQLKSLPKDFARQRATAPLPLYEAKQPPLYYWLLSWPLRIIDGWSLPSRVFGLRILSLIFASLVIPFGFVVARRVFRQDGPALGIVAIIAAMPELMINVCRVGNESLSIVFYTLATYFFLRMVETERHIKNAWFLGIILGLGLLTKAYFLAALPCAALVLLWIFLRSRCKPIRVLIETLAVLAPVCILSGWWYWRNIRLGSSLSGEGLGGLFLADLTKHIPEVHWLDAADFMFFSHIWFGAWSFLQVRSWIYHFFRYIVLIGIIGSVSSLCDSVARR
jgi:hypothetical protein